MDIHEFLSNWFGSHPEEAEKMRAAMDAEQHEGPWWAGLVACWHCDHEWVAVIPVPDTETRPDVMECPACSLMAGVPAK